MVQQTNKPLKGTNWPLLGGHHRQQDALCHQGRAGSKATCSINNVPHRRDKAKLSASEALRSAVLPSHSFVISQHSKGSMSSDLLMHQGPPDTAEIIKSLPQKYRRNPVSQEEMEFIQQGGPE
jgi:small subunit ribosomal protein S36